MSNREKMLLVDVDGVLLHWVNGFTKFLLEQHDITVPENQNSHYIHEWLEVHPDAALKLISDFNASHHFSLLEPLNQSDEFLPMFYEEGFRIVAVTSCSSDTKIGEMRRENLHRYFGDIFETIHCLDLHQCKSDILKQYPKGYWVEDIPSWALKGAEAGHLTFLMDHSYNRSFKDSNVIRAKDWYMIYQFVHALTKHEKIIKNLKIGGY